MRVKMCSCGIGYVPYYSLPGGYVHRDETGRQAAARELFEETGVRVRSERIFGRLSTSSTSGKGSGSTSRSSSSKWPNDPW